MLAQFSVLQLFPVALGFVAVWFLLPQLRRQPAVVGVAAGVAGLLLLLLLYFRSSGSLAADFLFYVFGGMAVVAGVCMITQKNPVYAALWFAIVILSSCGLFLLAAAPFLAAATIIVYAGAIIVTFLFVIMLAQQTGIALYDRSAREPLLAALGGFILLGGFFYAIEQAFPTNDTPATMEVLDVRRMECGKIIAKLTNALQLLGQGQSPEIVSIVLYDDPRRPETAVSTQLREELQLLAPSTRQPMMEELDRLSGELGLAQAAGNRDGMAESLQSMHVLADRVAARVTGSDLSQATANAPLGSVAGLGKSLFTDYLIGVELAGTALLVATIGAIVIAARRKEGLP